MSSILGYTLSEEIESQIRDEWLTAYNSIEEAESAISILKEKIDLEDETEEYKNRLIFIMQKNFMWLNIDEINNLIRYFLYLQIIAQEEYLKLKEEESKKNKIFQEKLVEEIIEMKENNDFTNISEKVNQLDFYWFEKYFASTSFFEKKKMADIYDKMAKVKSIWLNIFRYLFVKLIQDRKYFERILIPTNSIWRVIFIKDLKWDLEKFKKYEKYIMWFSNSKNNYFLYLRSYIKYSENEEWKIYSIEEIEKAWISLELFLNTYYENNKWNKMNKIIEKIEKKY